MKVYSSPNPAMVGHLRIVLETQGIACDVRGEYRGILAGAVPPVQCWPELWVMEDSQVESARELICEALKPGVYYAAHWNCPNCDEDLEGQFTICWKCGTNRPEDEAKDENQDC